MPFGNLQNLCSGVSIWLQWWYFRLTEASVLQLRNLVEVAPCCLLFCCFYPQNPLCDKEIFPPTATYLPHAFPPTRTSKVQGKPRTQEATLKDQFVQRDDDQPQVRTKASEQPLPFALPSCKTICREGEFIFFSQSNQIKSNAPCGTCNVGSRSRPARPGPEEPAP